MPEIVNVYATATFSQCPYLQLSQEDLDSLYMFITSKDHLKNNIASIHYDKIYSLWSSNAGTFDHAVQFRIGVRRQNLWEGLDPTYGSILVQMYGSEEMELWSNCHAFIRSDISLLMYTCIWTIFNVFENKRYR